LTLLNRDIGVIGDKHYFVSFSMGKKML